MRLSICLTLKHRSVVKTDHGILNLFPKCVESIRATCPFEYELIIGDFFSSDNPEDYLVHPNERIFKIDGPFSRGKGLNLAVAKSSYDNILLFDADMLVTGPELWDRGECVLNKNEALFPVCYSFSNPQHTEGWWRHSGYGMSFFTRSAWNKIGGIREFDTHGLEDDIFHREMRTKARVRVLRERVSNYYHQWHPNEKEWKERYHAKNISVLGESSGAENARDNK